MENDLVEIPRGRFTEEAFVRNVDVALQYIESWLRGTDAYPIYNLMEDRRRPRFPGHRSGNGSDTGLA